MMSSLSHTVPILSCSTMGKRWRLRVCVCVCVCVCNTSHVLLCVMCVCMYGHVTILLHVICVHVCNITDG